MQCFVTEHHIWGNRREHYDQSATTSDWNRHHVMSCSIADCIVIAIKNVRNKCYTTTAELVHKLILWQDNYSQCYYCGEQLVKDINFYNIHTMHFYYLNLTTSLFSCIVTIIRRLLKQSFLWSPYGKGQTIIFSSCGFFFLLLFSFFPRLISAAGDCMSAILPHMVWP